MRTKAFSLVEIIVSISILSFIAVSFCGITSCIKRTVAYAELCHLISNKMLAILQAASSDKLPFELKSSDDFPAPPAADADFSSVLYNYIDAAGEKLKNPGTFDVDTLTGKITACYLVSYKVIERDIETGHYLVDYKIDVWWGRNGKNSLIMENKDENAHRAYALRCYKKNAEFTEDATKM